MVEKTSEGINHPANGTANHRGCGSGTKKDGPRRAISLSKPRGNRLILWILGPLLSIALMAPFYQGCKSTSRKDMEQIEDAITLLNESLGKFGAVEDRIASLDKQVSALQHSLKNQEMSGQLLAEKLEKLNQEIGLLKERIDSFEAKANLQTSKRHHVVSPGDTLYRIGLRYGISVDELRRLNHLTAEQPIHPGQRLVILPDTNP